MKPSCYVSERKFLVDKSAEQGLTDITGILQWSINFLISSQQNARNFMDQ